MNLFMPFPDIKRSVESLDDKRHLIKQILECYQIHRVAMGASTGYKNHPIVAFILIIINLSPTMVITVV